MKLSIVIPAHNEQDSIEKVVNDIVSELENERIVSEIILVNDNSTDDTPLILEKMASKNPNIKVVHNNPPKGLGRAIRKGLENITGDIVVITMADGSDESKDIIKYYKKIQEGYDCVFGSRFIKGSVVKDYPLLKLLMNRLGNKFIQVLFHIKNNDITNAFKAYRTNVIKAVQPLQSVHFNITVEIPLKAIIRGFSYATIPINWHGRKAGVSKHKLKELAKEYLVTVLYIWFEKLLLRYNQS